MLDAESKKLAEELLFQEKKKPSFVKQLFQGRFDQALVMPFPYPEPSVRAEAEKYAEKIKQFMADHVDAKAIDRAGTIPKEVIEGLGDLGLLSLTIPKQYGGLGLSQYAYCRAMEEVSRKCAATALFINAHQSVGLKALLLFGTDAQKDKWLPKLGKGRSLAAFSLTEKNAGSDAAGIETVAEYDPGKKSYFISGRKQWTTNGSIAEILTVMAKTGDKVTAFLVTPDMKGFSVLDRALDKVGMRGSTTSNLQFERVEVPEANILGPKGGGLKVCLTVLDYGRTTFGATCTGAAREAVSLATSHAIKRMQFKRPLASFALVKKKIADMHAKLYAMESTTMMTAGLLDQGVEDIMLESAILKVFTSESLWQIIYEAMQIYGGRSFFTDAPLERMMRDARLNMIGEGSNEVLRAFIGAVGLRDLGMDLKGLKEQFNPYGVYAKVKELLIPPSVAVKSAFLKEPAASLSDAVRSFSRACCKALVRYREQIVEEQLVLNRITEAVIALYTSTAVISRLDSDDPTQAEKQAGLLYVDQALQNLHRVLDNLFDPDDQEIYALSDLVTGMKK
jgi:acyl-CoA dehydrogenase family protein 9